MSKTILITAANGTVGHHLANRLLLAGHAVRSATRRPNGANSVALDFSNPQTFHTALDGSEAVYLVVPTGTNDPFTFLSPLIDAAAARGAKLVLQSALGVDANEAIPLRRLERKIESSGVPFVILRPNWFFDNFHGRWFVDIVKNHVISLPAATSAISFIDARDIADVAVAVLTRSVSDGEALTLTGAESLTYTEAASALSSVIGSTITYRPISSEEFVARADAMGLPASHVAQMVPIFFPVRQGWVAAVTNDVSRLTGRPARRMVDYFADNAWRFTRVQGRAEVT